MLTTVYPSVLAVARVSIARIRMSSCACSRCWLICRCSICICLRSALCSRDSLGRPLALAAGPTAMPLLASHASSTHPTTSSVPASTTRLRMGSEPRTPMLTTHWKASEKRYAACVSKFFGFSAGTGGGRGRLGGARP